MLRSHVETIREHPFLKHAWIIFVCERNTAFESAHQWKIISEYNRTYALYQHSQSNSKKKDTPQQNPGIFTGQFNLD